MSTPFSPISTLVATALLALPALALPTLAPAGVASAEETTPSASSPPTGSATTGWYGAIGLDRNMGHGPDDTGITALAGYRFLPNLGAEVELTDGLRDGGHHHGLDTTDTGSTDHRRHGAALFSAAAYGVAYLPLTPHLQLLARLGVGQTHFDGDPAHPGKLDLTSLNAGVGALYNLNATNALRVDFTHKAYDHHGDDQAIGVSFVHKF